MPNSVEVEVEGPLGFPSEGVRPQSGTQVFGWPSGAVRPPTDGRLNLLGMALWTRQG